MSHTPDELAPRPRGAPLVPATHLEIPITFSLDKQTVIGALKASGSKDPDVLYTTKKKLIEQPRVLHPYSWIPMICGVLLSLTIIGPSSAFRCWRSASGCA